jgi:hypothetical protein
MFTNLFKRSNALLHSKFGRFEQNLFKTLACRNQLRVGRGEAKYFTTEARRTQRNTEEIFITKRIIKNKSKFFYAFTFDFFSAEASAKRSAAISNCLYHSLPYLRVSDSFKNLKTGTCRLAPNLQAALHTLQRS